MGGTACGDDGYAARYDINGASAALIRTALLFVTIIHHTMDCVKCFVFCLCGGTCTICLSYVLSLLLTYHLSVDVLLVTLCSLFVQLLTHIWTFLLSNSKNPSTIILSIHNHLTVSWHMHLHKWIDSLSRENDVVMYPLSV
jgi:hypothetical protein